MKERQTAHVAALLCALLSVAPLAFAQEVDDTTRNSARSLAGQGKDAYDGKDYSRAFDLFRRAYALVPAPTIALYEGQSLTKLGRFVEAEEAFMRAVHTSLDSHASDQFRKAVRDAEQELGQLQPRIPRVTIVVTGPGAQSPNLAVALDGKAVKNAVLGVEMPIDPGQHELTTDAGGERAQLTFSILEKERKSVEIQALAATDEAAPVTPPMSNEEAPPRDLPPPRPVSSWQKPAAFVAGGVGVAGLATGIVAGLMATSRHTTAERECPNRVCTEGSSGSDALQSFRTLRTVSTIGYIAGGVGLAAGATLYFTAPSKPPASAASVGVWVGASSVGVLGAF